MQLPDGECIRPFAGRHQCWRQSMVGPVWLAKEPPRTRWPAAPGTDLLRTLGIEIVFGREGRLGTRTIRITAIGEHQSGNTVSTVSRVSDNNGGHGAGLRHPPPGLGQAL